MRKSRYSLSTLQLTFALYMMCVSLSGPCRARTLRISMYISSLDLRTIFFHLFGSCLFFYINALWIQNSFCAGVPLCFCLYFEEYAYSVEESCNDVVCEHALHVLAEFFHFVLEHFPHLVL